MLRIMTEKRFQEHLKEAQEKVYKQERLERKFIEVFERIDNLYKRVCVLEDRLHPVQTNTEVRQ